MLVGRFFVKIPVLAIAGSVLDHRAERQRREEGQAADDQHHADEEADEQPAMGREGAIGMLVGRFFVKIPVLAIAGSLAAKKRLPASAGTFPPTRRPTNSPPWVGKVPAEAGSRFLAASEPAMARTWRSARWSSTSPVRPARPSRPEAEMPRPVPNRRMPRHHPGAASQPPGAKVWPAAPAKCSTTGPSASAGKKVRPPMISTTPTTMLHHRAHGAEARPVRISDLVLALLGVALLGGLALAAAFTPPGAKVWPAAPAKCSTTGPSASAGKKSRTSCWPSSVWRCSAASPSQRPSP
jgi:hypothetical protein